MKTLRYILGWLLVRPRRWLFCNMVWNYKLRLLPKRHEWCGWEWPNVHWWALYHTVFRFCKWLQWGLRDKLCVWDDRGLVREPWYARAVRRLGKTTAGYACSGGECFHCGSEAGDPVWLSDDETGHTFHLLETWTSASENGTDHRFRGITTCPKCGFQQEYEDGSL